MIFIKLRKYIVANISLIRETSSTTVFVFQKALYKIEETAHHIDFNVFR